MSVQGLGCVKTPERDTRVEAPRPNCASRESNHTAHGQLEASLENCIFYILPMYEFLHSQGHSRRFWPIRATSAIHPIATELADIAECPKKQVARMSEEIRDFRCDAGPACRCADAGYGMLNVQLVRCRCNSKGITTAQRRGRLQAVRSIHCQACA